MSQICELCGFLREIWGNKCMCEDCLEAEEAENDYAKLMIQIDIRRSISEAIRAECGDSPFWQITRKVMDI